jgi:RNA-directed DNA polymerase
MGIGCTGPEGRPQGAHYKYNEIQLKLMMRQKGRCAWCGLVLTPTDVVEIDHRIPRSKGGVDRLVNMQLLHEHCHDEKSRSD